MKTVKFTDDNETSVEVTGCSTLDEAVVTADAFLDRYGMCVVNGGQYYGDDSPADIRECFPVTN